MTLSKITFEKENGSNTSVLAIRDGKTIGRIWSELSDGTLPFPHNKDSVEVNNSIQICGFDRISEVWPCGPFEGKKDCVVSFNTTEDPYSIQKIGEYEEYVKEFFSNVIKDSKVKGFQLIKSTTIKDLTKLKSFNDWLLHNP